MASKPRRRGFLKEKAQSTQCICLFVFLLQAGRVNLESKQQPIAFSVLGKLKGTGFYQSFFTPGEHFLVY
jgi:hypothetical protein